jgi:hypothetical protein
LLNDSHYKVQLKCQNAAFILLLNIEKLERNQRDSVFTNKEFESIHSKILINLTDKRKEVNESALRLVDKIRMIFDKDYLVMRTLNVVDVKNSRAKIASFEFLASIIKDAKAFSNDSKLLKKCVKKCMLYLSQNSNDTNFIGPILSILL